MPARDEAALRGAMSGVQLQFPAALTLLLLLPLVLYGRRRARERLWFSHVELFRGCAKTTLWRRCYDDAFCAGVFACLVLGIANVGYSRESIEEFIESKWIVLALDLSGSMKRPSSEPTGETLEELAIDSMEAFIELRREEDYVGLVAFSSTPKLLAPLTFDRELLRRKLDLVRRKHQSRVYRELSAGGGTNASDAVWLGLSVFFSMLPETHRLSVNEIAGLRDFLLGGTSDLLDVPDKLRKARFGTGMAVILFTDGRIEPTLRAHGGRRRIPNLVNIIRLMREIGVKLYIIAVGGDIDEAVARAMEGDGASSIGRIFVTPKRLDRAGIAAVYREIHELEANRILSRVTVGREWMRRPLTLLAVVLMVGHFAARSTPGLRRV